MSKIALSILFFLFGLMAYAQEPYIKLPFAKKDCPTFLLHRDIIVDQSVLRAKKDLIQERSVLYDAIDRKEQKFYNLTEYGLIFIEMKSEIAVKSQSEINAFFGLDLKNRIYVDGYLLENREYKIATASIVEMEVIEPNSENKLETKVINVWTLSPIDRVEGCNQSD